MFILPQLVVPALEKFLTFFCFSNFYLLLHIVRYDFDMTNLFSLDVYVCAGWMAMSVPYDHTASIEASSFSLLGRL
jgi:hypothetical protein